MEEGWTEKHTGGSLHAWRLTLSLSEPTENTKCYAPRHAANSAALLSAA